MAASTTTAQQQQQPQPPQQQRRGGITWLLHIITLVLRICLWPLRRLTQTLFPSKEYDGLSAAVTAKAVQAFVNELRQITPPPSSSLSSPREQQNCNNNISDSASSFVCDKGFAALRQDASESSSLILVYLHSPLLRNADTIRRRLLLDDRVLDFLRTNNNFIKVFGVSIHTAQGAHLAQLLGATSYPLLVLLLPPPTTTTTGSSRSSSSSSANSLQLLLRAEGPVLEGMKPNQLLIFLQLTVTKHQTAVAEIEARRIQRQEEQQLRREQDREYQETLRADQERQRQLKEEAERERQRIAEEEDAKRKEQEEYEERIGIAQSLLKDEPPSSSSSSTADVARIRFTLPTGARIERRFYSDENFSVLRAFLTLHFHNNNNNDNNGKDNTNKNSAGGFIHNIGLSTNYPKKSYDDTDENNKLTLKEAGLSPQAVLMVQDLDA